MPRYLVTGCAGFIGSHLAASLLERGDEVVGVDAFTDYYPRERKERNAGPLREHAGFRLVEGDLGRLALHELLASLDGVFHLAAQPGVRASWGGSFPVYVQRNLVVSQRVFEAAADVGVRVIHASSSSIYGDAAAYPTPEETPPRPVSPYGVTKLGCEHLAHVYRTSFGLEVVLVRYFTVYGPRQRPDMAFSRILTALLTGTPFQIHGTGEQSRDFTYVADAVSATLAAMDAAPSGSVYNVGGGTEATLREVIELSERITGRRLDAKVGAPAAGDPRRTAADTTRIRAELGWRPRTSLAEGLAAQLEELAAALEAGEPRRRRRAGTRMAGRQ